MLCCCQENTTQHNTTHRKSLCCFIPTVFTSHIYVCEVIIAPEFGVTADVQLTIDATNTDDVNASIEAFENVASVEWEVESEAVFITSVPTASPSITPSLSPSTLLPTRQPSITGLVVTIDVIDSSFF